MRKAAKQTDFDCELADYDAPAPARRARGRSLLGANPATRIGVFGLTLLTGAIVVNALLLQDQRHSAPLFQAKLNMPAASIEAEAPMPAPRPAELAVVKPVAKPAEVAHVDTPRADPIAREIARIEAPAPRAEKPKVAEAKAEAKSETKTAETKTTEAKVQRKSAETVKTADNRKPDAIGGLMRSVGIADTHSAEPDPSVRAAQRALMKLGFVIRPDGVFNGTTREAIQRFERDNNLPVRGALSPSVKRELARMSGVVVD